MTLEEDLRRALEAQGKGNQKLAKLKSCIVKGESLGDPLKDYLLVFYGRTEFPSLEAEFKTLSDKIQANQGQQVMLLYVKSELVEKGGCFSSPLYDSEVVGQKLGLLDGELRFDLTKGEVLLPAQNYVQKGDDLHIWNIDGHSWELKTGGIPVPGYHFEASSFFEEDKLPKLEVLFGDEVELYFSVEKTFFEHYLEDRSEAWKKHLLEERGYVEGEYLVALNLLGVEAPARFKQKYDAQVQRHRDQVLEGIRSQKNAPQYLKQALELGLHKEEQTIQLEPGISMNLPEYLRTQCNKHGIKVPE